MKKAVYPGSFDPLSNGHLDIIKRACKQFDVVYVLVSKNINKKTTFTVDERIQLIQECTKDIPNVIVTSTSDLVVRFARENDISVIIRGLRNIQDYENEFNLYQFNRNIDKEIETILLFPSTTNLFVSSSAIKELVCFDVDITPYVPIEIADKIIKKFKENKSAEK